MELKHGQKEEDQKVILKQESERVLLLIVQVNIKKFL